MTWSDVDIGRVLRFGIVGASVAGLYIVLFLGLRQFGVGPAIASVTAYAAAVLFQYFAQTWWTFRRQPLTGRYSLRFAVMVGVGAGLSALITAWIGPMFGAPDAASAAVVVVATPVFNFIVMSLWVYRGGAASG